MKKGYNIGVEPLMLKSLKFFFENPYKEVYLREFSREVKVSLNSAQRFLSLFIRQKFIVDFRKGNLRFFKANLDSIVFRHLKIAFSLKKIEDSGMVSFLKEKFSNVVLFGSIAKGEDDITSDVDLLCIGKERPDLFEFEKKLRREINIHVFNFMEWEKQKKENKAFYQDVITTGINLIGEIPV